MVWGSLTKCCRQGDDIIARRLLSRIVPIDVEGLPAGSYLKFDKAELRDVDGDGDAVRVNLKHFTIESVALMGKGGMEVPLMGCQKASVTLTVGIHKEHWSPTCTVTVLDIDTDHGFINAVLGWGVKEFVKRKIEEEIDAAINECSASESEDDDEVVEVFEPARTSWCGF
eukprot:gnl/MRDRNA2_/MRDRNA2_153572_c0_seq1.p2 gnl/MRDRNA2_/MRDRNA2_153572_c0~~gnl/MRDRNA2_/MRDRNA2_153572_c0_seq1.p2  ORF type:complete len:170 (-),score=44.70 gnl/MRDRNA2_/MRDRNA2_153572_c0_seq1:38-547(-)